MRNDNLFPANLKCVIKIFVRYKFTDIQGLQKVLEHENISKTINYNEKYVKNKGVGLNKMYLMMIRI